MTTPNDPVSREKVLGARTGLAGISVDCALCGHMKQPHGRSAPILGPRYCNDDCEGYALDPKPGCFWPGETSEEFGYYCCDHATRAK